MADDPVLAAIGRLDAKLDTSVARLDTSVARLETKLDASVARRIEVASTQYARHDERESRGGRRQGGVMGLIQPPLTKTEVRRVVKDDRGTSRR